MGVWGMAGVGTGNWVCGGEKGGNMCFMCYAIFSELIEGRVNRYIKVGGLFIPLTKTGRGLLKRASGAYTPKMNF